jgi:uncharacterized protein
MDVFGYIAAIFIGVILGILGGGGSILSIPILVYIFHVDAVLASAYSLFIVGTTSLVGAIPKYKSHLVNIKTGFLFGVPSIVTIFVTRKWIIPALPDIIWATESFTITKRGLVLGIFAILMVLASISMIRGRKRSEQSNQHFKIFLIVIQGILIGFLTGLVGAGGGFLIIPALVLLTGLPFKQAVGTSLFVIAINSLVGFMGDVFNTAMDWPFLLSITLLAIGGVLIGNKLSGMVSQIQLRKSFGWFVLVMGCWMLVREFLLF